MCFSCEGICYSCTHLIDFMHHISTVVSTEETEDVTCSNMALSMVLIVLLGEVESAHRNGNIEVK